MKKFNFFSISIIILIVTALLSGIGLRYYLQHKKEVTKVNGIIFPLPRNLHDFTLINQEGKSFTNVNLKNQWSLLFFGFTHCPVICPTTLSILNQAYSKLKNDHFIPLPQVLFISVDPQRDSPQLVSQYAQGFNPEFIGLMGDEKDLTQLTHDMNAVFMKMKINGSSNSGGNTYTIDHSTSIGLIDPKGKLRAILSNPDNGDQFAHDYEEIIKQLRE
ncbi:MAG: hypothetical protein LEGION0398_MBIBDBAK_00624 [Legionellaceae bacterium]